MKARVEQRTFKRQHAGNEELARNRPNDGGGGCSSGLPIGLDIHNLAKHVRVHSEQCPEQHRRPTQLGNMVQPAAEDKDE